MSTHTTYHICESTLNEMSALVLSASVSRFLSAIVCCSSRARQMTSGALPVHKTSRDSRGVLPERVRSGGASASSRMYALLHLFRERPAKKGLEG